MNNAFAAYTHSLTTDIASIPGSEDFSLLISRPIDLTQVGGERKRNRNVRTAATVLRSESRPYYIEVSAATGIVMGYDAGLRDLDGLMRYRVRARSRCEYVEICPEITAAAARGHYLSRKIRVARMVLTAAYFLFGRRDPVLRDVFFAGLQSDSADAPEAVKVLGRAFRGRPASMAHTRKGRYSDLCRLVTVWNACREHSGIAVGTAELAVAADFSKSRLVDVR